MSIFKDNVAYRPFIYPWAVEAEKRHRIDMNWNENQIDLADDIRQYNTKGGLATANVPHEQNKYMIDKLQLLFTEMDVQVAGGYSKLIAHVKNNEIKTMWITFAAREVTHQRGYALAAETLGFSDSDWSEFKQYKEMQDKIDIMSQEVGDLSIPLNFAKALGIVLLGEGIALFGPFSCFLNLRRFGKMQNFNSVNEWSLKDEADHVLNNIKVLQEVKKELSEREQLLLKEYLIDLTMRYVHAEHLFLDLVFEKGDQEQFTKEEAKSFITYLGELRVHQLGYLDAESVMDNPLEWMDYILSAKTHTNFFENKVTEYSHKKLEGGLDLSKYKESLVDRVFS